MTEQKAKEMRELARHVKPLHGFLVRRGVSEFDAWDILQEALIKVFNRRDTLPECLEQRKAILFGEVNAQMKAHFSERRRMLERIARAQELIAFMGLTEQRDMSRVLEARQLLELILPELSPDEYQVFTDKVLDDLTIREVAERRGRKAHATKTHWFRALATLKEKLESIEHRGARGFIVFAIIAGILGVAKNASAMVERLRRFFRALRQVQLHNLTGFATAAVVMFSPPNSGASADDVTHSPRHTSSAGLSGAVMEPKAEPGSSVPEKTATAAKPNVSHAPAQSFPLASPRRSVSNKPAAKARSSEYLIAMAIAALRDGNSERTLVLLDQYQAANASAASSAVVKTLRADAQAAIAAR